MNGQRKRPRKVEGANTGGVILADERVVAQEENRCT